MDPARPGTPELIFAYPGNINDCNCAIRMAMPALEQQVWCQIIKLDEVESLENALAESLNAILAGTDFHRVFQNVLQQLGTIRNQLEKSLRTYNAAMRAGFTTDSFDFVHYISAFWHIPPGALQKNLNAAIFYLRFKFRNLEREENIERWNSEFTEGDRLTMTEISEELETFSNRINKVQHQAGIA
ncbi:uncharacterized protein LOC142342073 [Convolutriloba macropyga]|uniref:uncharacterized protein LOC142342073 n=1 Tax=Convolutriloba macropyga TaxID=536237 RepID=UPI003F51BD37